MFFAAKELDEYDDYDITNRFYLSLGFEVFEEIWGKRKSLSDLCDGFEIEDEA